MIKRGFGLVLALLFLVFVSSSFISVVSASSIDDEFKKLANYAGEYETGNIDYIQLLVYTSSIREKMNEVLGTKGKNDGGILKEEQIKNILGNAETDTKWVWSEREQREIKLEAPVPVWEKIVFDGKKIQIKLNARPFIFGKKENQADSEKQNKQKTDLEGQLVYRLDFQTIFKKPEAQLNIQNKIEEISVLAQTFNSNPSTENAEALAKESVNAEKSFESYFRQSGEKCEDLMSVIFGSENKRQTQQMLVQEISFCEGDNFEVIARLEMCDDCEWNYVNLDFWVEGRGPGFKFKEEKIEQISAKNFENLDTLEIQAEIKKLVEETKQLCTNRNFNSISSTKSRLWALNDAWNQKSNNVWQEVDKTFNSQIESMTQEQRQEFDKNYGWIKLDQQKRQKVNEIIKVNYELRKQFYLDLFSGYDKEEYSFSQVEFQKRLIEQFREKGEEICSNNVDDNKNQAVDCADDQCGGKVCGKGISNVSYGNETREEEVDFYCIEKECRAREEKIEIVRNVSMICPEIPAIECAEGSKAFFSKYDNETNCPLEASCLNETDSCEVNEDCKQPACGIAECISNKCEVTGLTECKELECVDGEEKICESDGKIVEICIDGFWEKTGECAIEPEIREEIIVGNECLSAGDCGENNVCNNGVCQLIPEVIIVESEKEETEEKTDKTKEENRESEEETEENKIDEEDKEKEESEKESESNEEKEEESESEIESSSESESSSGQSSSETETEGGITGGVIFSSIKEVFSKIKILGAVITGFEVEEGNSEPSSEDSGDSGSSENGDVDGNEGGGEGSELVNENNEQGNGGSENEQGREIINTYNEEDGEREERDREEDRNREQENEKREEENRARCKTECERPCVDKCIRTECGEKLDCIVEDAQEKCEDSCEPEDDCVEKCMKGGDWWKEYENKEEFKEEKGVFQVGGSCRTSNSKTEGFIWFGGWGDPFEQIQQLKNKYYNGGQADWCKEDFENLKKQREEFEKGLNQDFAKWFFEDYLANSAENWEQAVSGIFELYWKDVDNSREMAYRMKCLEIDELPEVNLINFKYATEYGSIEFWEEIKTVKLEGMDNEVQVISPYMKAWVFPTKQFIEYEMKKSMKNHEFPGSSEEKTERNNEEGLTKEEKEMIKQDKNFMKTIKQISDKYGGNLDVSIQLVDYENNEIMFNLYAQINENDVVKIEPMLPEEVPAQDIKIEIDFNNIYDMIYQQEKEMSGERVESPPWDKKTNPVQKIKEIKDGVKMFFKIREIINSAKISPVESEKDIKKLFKSFAYMMARESGGNGGGGEGDNKNNGEEGSDTKKDATENVWDSKEVITGEVILN